MNDTLSNSNVTSQDPVAKSTMVTGLFNDRASAERAYEPVAFWRRRRG